jgi:N-acetylneuraminic acid mutarotase
VRLDSNYIYKMKSKLHIFLILFSLVAAVVQAQNNFTNTGSLITGRQIHTATLLPNGLVLVTGGETLTNGRLASAELYNPATGTWTTTGSLANARDYHTATLLPNGMVLVTGGVDTNGNKLASAELYNPATGTWTATGSLATARNGHTATLLPNGMVLVTGGYNGGYLASAELYNPATGTWMATGSLATARDGHTATLLPNGLVLVVGGMNNDNIENPVLASAELYNPATGTWTNTGSLNLARDGHTATLLPNGTVLVAGGINYYSDLLATCELYNPAAGAWTTTGSLATWRIGPTATLLPNGTVLAAAGANVATSGGSNGDLASAELYNPATGTWTTTGSLATARAYHTATLLPNGTVLIAGGHDTNGNVLASAELYNSGFGLQTLAVGSTITAQTVNGLFTLNFTNVIGMPFSVLTTTNAALPVASWSVLGVPTELFPGYFQFTDPQLPTASQQFYQFISP